MQISSSRFKSRGSSDTSGARFQNVLGGRGDSLTDKERDEIDYEANAIIRQTMNQVKVMEHNEQGILRFTLRK
jgi:hypothetical protein